MWASIKAPGSTAPAAAVFASFMISSLLRTTYWSLTPNELLRQLETTGDGLASGEAAAAYVAAAEAAKYWFFRKLWIRGASALE